LLALLRRQVSAATARPPHHPSFLLAVENVEGVNVEGDKTKNKDQDNDKGWEKPVFQRISCIELDMSFNVFKPFPFNVFQLFQRIWRMKDVERC
jgi:hypothetical protein